MENLILYNSPYEKIRIGKDNDGGYLLCNLPGIYDLFIGGGVSSDISFEKKFLSFYKNIPAYIFDGTVEKLPEHVENLIFIKKNLGNINNDNLTNLIEYLHNYNDVFMKIDIEGHEFRLIPEIIKNNYMEKIKQLVIEIHSPGDINMFPEYFIGLQDIDNNLMFKMLSDINKTHTLVHFHANNGCKMQKIDNINLPHVFELTYVRNDFINTKIINSEPLPSKLDMKNVIDKPDYYFDYYPYCILNSEKKVE